MVGEETSGLLGIQLNRFDRVGSSFMGWVMGVLGKFEGEAYQDLGKTHQAAEWLFREMAKEIWMLPRGGQRDLFFILTELADGWRLNRA